MLFKFTAFHIRNCHLSISGVSRWNITKINKKAVHLSLRNAICTVVCLVPNILPCYSNLITSYIIFVVTFLSDCSMLKFTIIINNTHKVSAKCHFVKSYTEWKAKLLEQNFMSKIHQIYLMLVLIVIYLPDIFCNEQGANQYMLMIFQ